MNCFCPLNTSLLEEDFPSAPVMLSVKKKYQVTNSHLIGHPIVYGPLHRMSITVKNIFCAFISSIYSLFHIFIDY
jgi:hypothetical protein